MEDASADWNVLDFEHGRRESTWLCCTHAHTGQHILLVYIYMYVHSVLYTLVIVLHTLGNIFFWYIYTVCVLYAGPVFLPSYIYVCVCMYVCNIYCVVYTSHIVLSARFLDHYCRVYSVV